MVDFAKLPLPIIQAPMAGGINTPELAAAVANNGGVGSFGFAYSKPDQIAADLSATRRLTQGPINANFFVFSPAAMPSETEAQDALNALRSLAIQCDVELALPQLPYYPDLLTQLEPIWAARPAMLTFHFGLPPEGVIKQAHALGICVGMTATNGAEAEAIERAGADFIVAQGIEAGGHRGCFHQDQEDDQLSALELTKVLASRCRIPIVTAGAIMTGADIRAALHHGASAAQLGTAFLCCDEAGTPPSYRNFLLRHPERGAALTRVFSGRSARGVQNAFMLEMGGKTVLPFPIQNTLTAPLRQWAVKNHNGEYQSLWAGSAYSKIRPMPAANLMRRLRAEWMAEER
ncbi:MAG: nitronate monooxygenase [Polynucleobacter sp.]|nr:nitronate monooxygenase [Polynucleobacter sp.]